MSALSEFILQNSIKGFLAGDEGDALYHYALEVAKIGPCLEIGSYCGKSTVYLGTACRDSDNVLFAVDHHRGSEEHQRHEQYHDPELFDSHIERMDSFPSFRRTLALAQLETTVVPVVASSQLTAKAWTTPLGLVFIDGGHSHDSAMADCTSWAAKLAPGGLLAVHDLFPKPEDGGQGPYLAFEHVRHSGGFEYVTQVSSLGVFRKVGR